LNFTSLSPYHGPVLHRPVDAAHLFGKFERPLAAGCGMHTKSVAGYLRSDMPLSGDITEAAQFLSPSLWPLRADKRKCDAKRLSGHKVGFLTRPCCQAQSHALGYNSPPIPVTWCTAQCADAAPWPWKR
jgi:hypothetical protein